MQHDDDDDERARAVRKKRRINGDDDDEDNLKKKTIAKRFLFLEGFSLSKYLISWKREHYTAFDQHEKHWGRFRFKTSPPMSSSI